MNFTREQMLIKPELIDAWLDQLFLLMQSRGSAHYGEGISQLDHMLQSAQLAVDMNYPEHLVGAALLHDIGHLLGDEPKDVAAQGIDTKHEQRGSAWLAQVFPESVYVPIALHVAVKRYRCTVDPDYHSSLSHASLLSLALQGGLMSSEQVTAFQNSRWFEEAVALRTLDDYAKKTDAKPAGLQSYRPLLKKMILNQSI
ncbi:HD domain-containing protein [Aquirhabdus sp.]|uniref:HD domain-containing protein n=1 Tax=Aquirhabdus sp. TaxID=2824160 RepID=UPI00396CB197